MKNDFLLYISNNDLFKTDSRILVAVSGGIDSMVMANLFLASGYYFGIAHCNFSLRGRDSDNDEALVKKYAATNNLPFYSKRFDTIKYSNEKHVSIQVAARELRYEWFEQCRLEQGYRHIAIAHNLNDNIETMLINIVRGTGLKGLGGIKNKTGNIVRPLLFATREQITRYASDHRVKYRVDRSNNETKYSRNKIRHLVIPVLKEINPSLESTLDQMTKRMVEIHKYLSVNIAEEKKRLFKKNEDEISINTEELKPYLENHSIMYEILKEFGINDSILGNLTTMVGSQSGKQLFTSTHRIINDRNRLIITPLTARESFLIEINDIKELKAIDFLSVFIKKIDNDFVIPRDKKTASIDTGKLEFPLKIRHWREGDSFHPFGMKGNKKLSDYMIDNKYSLADKENAMVLLSGEEIVWLLGERMDDRFKITDKTTEALILVLKSSHIR